MKYEKYQKLKSRRYNKQRPSCIEYKGGIIFADGEISGQFTMEEFLKEQERQRKRKWLKWL